MNDESPIQSKSTQATGQPGTAERHIKQDKKKCPGDGALTASLPVQCPASDDTNAVSTPKTASSSLSANQAPSFSLFSQLPAEIQRHIFEIAYWSNAHYRGRNDWVLTCWKVRKWIDPLIYEHIALSGQHQVQERLSLYQRTFRSKPQEFYSKHVRRIYTNNNLEYNSSDFELELLSACDNVMSLDCWSDYREELSNILRTKSWPSLRALRIDIELLPKDENTFHLPIFQNITHLEFTSDQPQLPWESLQHLENLTHMRVYTLVGVEDFREAMDHTYATAVEARKYFPPNLKYFVFTVPENFIYMIANMEAASVGDRQRWDRMEDIRLGNFDARVVLGSCGNFEEYEDLELDERGLSNAMEYLTMVPALGCPIWCQDSYSSTNQSTWEAVSWSVRWRQKMQRKTREV